MLAFAGGAGRITGHCQRVLIADAARPAAELRSALSNEDLEIHCALFFDDAVRLAERFRPDIYVIGYHFDECRPYRLVSHLRGQTWSEKAPIVIVRALAMDTLFDEALIAESYRLLGVDDYLPLYARGNGNGREKAMMHFANIVRTHLRNMVG